MTQKEPGSLQTADSSPLGRLRLATDKKQRPLKILPTLRTALVAKTSDVQTVKERGTSALSYVRMASGGSLKFGPS